MAQLWYSIPDHFKQETRKYTSISCNLTLNNSVTLHEYTKAYDNLIFALAIVRVNNQQRS